MLLSAGARQALLIVHVLVSVGWIGGVIAYLVLDIEAASASAPAAYLAMQWIARRALVPLAWATLVSGIALGLGTRWGLVRHYWVLLSLVLTSLAVGVLMVEIRTIDRLADAARLGAAGGHTLPHSIGGLAVLIVVTCLNIVKPRGLTPYGWRKQQESTAQRTG